MLNFLDTWLFHWEPARAIWIDGHTLSWDARCSGIYVGFAAGLLYHAIMRLKTRTFPSAGFLLLNGILFLPLFLDVITVEYGWRMSSNDVKYLTGLAFGETFSLFLFTALLTLMYVDGDVRSAQDARKYFASCMAIGTAAFFLKDWNSAVAYGILEALSIFGFLSLAGILSAGIFLATRDLTNKKAS